MYPYPPLPMPGWYADPSGTPGAVRWWDGQGWNEAVGWVSPAHGADHRWPPAVGPAGTGPGPARPADVAPAAIPARAAWWAVLGLLVGELLAGVFGSLAAAASGDSAAASVTLAGEVGLWAGMLGACVFVSRRYGTGSIRRDFALRFAPADLGWGPVVAIGGLMATAVLGQLFVGSRLAGSNTDVINGHAHTTAGFAVITVIVSLGAPMFEELFFRGLVRTALAARLGPVGAIPAQAGLFALAHLNPAIGLGNVEVVVVIAALGIVLGLAAHFTRRLAAGMIGHGLYNLLVTVAVLTR